MPSLHVVSCVYEALFITQLISKYPLSVILEVGDAEGEVAILKTSGKFNSSLYRAE